MSSRILGAGTAFEALLWRASGNHQQQQKAGEADPSARDEHRPGEDPAQVRIRELEGRILLLEHRITQERATALEQGHQQGLAAGSQQEAAKWNDALARLGRAIEDMSKSKARFRAEVEEDAVKLALVIARKIMNRELATDPEALGGLARVALDKLNQRELQRVRVHPSDRQAIERILTGTSGPSRVEVIGDGTLERGAAIFETERGVLDASVTTQLGEIERGLADQLGRQSSC